MLSNTKEEISPINISDTSNRQKATRDFFKTVTEFLLYIRVLVTQFWFNYIRPGIMGNCLGNLIAAPNRAPDSSSYAGTPNQVGVGSRHYHPDHKQSPPVPISQNSVDLAIKRRQDENNQASYTTTIWPTEAKRQKKQEPASFNAGILRQFLNAQLRKFGSLDIYKGALPLLFDTNTKPQIPLRQTHSPQYLLGPNSPRNTVTQVSEHRERKQVPRWSKIEYELNQLIRALGAFQRPAPTLQIGRKVIATIKNYNPSEQGARFELLAQLPNTPEMAAILVSMAQVALEYPLVFPAGIPLLRAGQARIMFVSSRQVHCILANGFFCTFPKRGRNHPEYSSYPDPNFFSLYQNTRPSSFPAKVEKLKCIMNYFRRQMAHQEGGFISFERKVAPAQKDFGMSKKPLRPVHILTEGTIEGATGNLQVDFANKYVGGGVLGNGAVMEEIRFSICPELIASRLFTEVLGDNESLVITGASQFSRYNGYASTFRYAGDFNDNKLLLDDISRKTVQVLAIDAVQFPKSNPSIQFQRRSIDRELVKCYSGFYEHVPTTIGASVTLPLPPVASGNWGCGIFNGDPHLKYLIQWLAASESGRDLHLFTFGKGEHEFIGLCDLLQENGATVGDVYEVVVNYDRDCMSRNQGRNGTKDKNQLLEYIREKILLKNVGKQQKHF